MSCGPTSHRPFTARGHRALKKEKGQRPLFGPNLRLQRLSKPRFDIWRRPPTFGVVEPMKGFTTICGAPQYLSIRDKQK